MDLRLCWEKEGWLVLGCRGELSWDSAEAMLNKARGALHGRTAPQVIVDLEGVDCITSAGIGGLLQLRKLISDATGVLVMARLSPTIQRLFRTVGLDRHVPLLETLDEARHLLARRLTHQTGAKPAASIA